MEKILFVEEPLQAKLREPEPLTERRIQELGANLREPLKEMRPQELEEFLRHKASP